MSGIVWASGHIGWLLFALIVYTGLWALACDLVWRLKRISILRLALRMGIGWIIGLGVIVLAFWLGQP